MWPDKYGTYKPFNKQKKNGYQKRRASKGCFGNKRNDDKMIEVRR